MQSLFCCGMGLPLARLQALPSLLPCNILCFPSAVGVWLPAGWEQFTTEPVPLSFCSGWLWNLCFCLLAGADHSDVPRLRRPDQERREAGSVHRQGCCLAVARLRTLRRLATLLCTSLLSPCLVTLLSQPPEAGWFVKEWLIFLGLRHLDPETAPDACACPLPASAGGCSS